MRSWFATATCAAVCLGTLEAAADMMWVDREQAVTGCIDGVASPTVSPDKAGKTLRLGSGCADPGATGASHEIGYFVGPETPAAPARVVVRLTTQSAILRLPALPSFVGETASVVFYSKAKSVGSPIALRKVNGVLQAVITGALPPVGSGVVIVSNNAMASALTEPPTKQQKVIPVDFEVVDDSPSAQDPLANVIGSDGSFSVGLLESALDLGSVTCGPLNSIRCWEKGNVVVPDVVTDREVPVYAKLRDGFAWAAGATTSSVRRFTTLRRLVSWKAAVPLPLAAEDVRAVVTLNVPSAAACSLLHNFSYALTCAAGAPSPFQVTASDFDDKASICKVSLAASSVPQACDGARLVVAPATGARSEVNIPVSVIPKPTGLRATEVCYRNQPCTLAAVSLPSGTITPQTGARLPQDGTEVAVDGRLQSGTTSGLWRGVLSVALQSFYTPKALVGRLVCDDTSLRRDTEERMQVYAFKECRVTVARPADAPATVPIRACVTTKVNGLPASVASVDILTGVNTGEISSVTHLFELSGGDLKTLKAGDDIVIRVAPSSSAGVCDSVNGGSADPTIARVELVGGFPYLPVLDLSIAVGLGGAYRTTTPEKVADRFSPYTDAALRVMLRPLWKLDVPLELGLNVGAALQSSAVSTPLAPTEGAKTEEAKSNAATTVFGGLLLKVPFTGENGPVGASFAINRGLAGDWKGSTFYVLYFDLNVVSPARFQKWLVK